MAQMSKINEFSRVLNQKVKTPFHSPHIYTEKIKQHLCQSSYIAKF
jgi:hypothetical protein